MYTTFAPTSEMLAAQSRLESTRLALADMTELAEIFTRNQSLLRAVEPAWFEFLGEPEFEPEPYHAETTEWEELNALDDLTLYSLAPIRGGAPAFVPSEQDLADYAAWSESLERAQWAEWVAFNDAGRLNEADVIVATGAY